MVTIDYTFDPDELGKLADFDFGRLSLTDIDYYLFCGNVFFRVNGTALDTPWGWIPLFNHCVRLCFVLDELEKEKQAILEFTENEATISFSREGEAVFITADFVEAKAESVPFGELRMAVKLFADKLVADLVARWPALFTTAPFQERLQTIRSLVGRYLQQVWKKREGGVTFR